MRGPISNDDDVTGFAPHQVDLFRYTGVEFEESTAVARFHFELRGPDVLERFTETVAFAAPTVPLDRPRLDAVLVVLGAVLGLSYYKLAAPGRVELDVDGLSPAAREYLRLLIREGLAEFAYRNDLAGPLEPQITGRNDSVPRLAPVFPAGAPLVPIGGGKDSVVSVETLADAGLSPFQFAVNPNSVIDQVVAVSGHPFAGARRTLDPRLLELNADGGLNGHVPVTAMNSLIAVAQSLMLGLGPVVMSNESSASDPTLIWNGDPVNHQWSKSLDAEIALADMLREQAGLEEAYFSLLRPFSELRIARAFAQTSRYDHAIVSCNRAFRRNAASPSWCGECDKCRFVFLALAPHMPRERVIGIVGHDMFADESQLPGYRALMGLGDHKPFECVGEEAESTVAMSLVARMPSWAQSTVVSALLREVPELAAGDAALEARILGVAPATAVPPAYEEVRHAFV